MKASFLLLILLTLGCEKKEPNHPQTPYSPPVQPEGKLDIIWKVQIDSALRGAQSKQPLVWQDKVLWNAAPGGDGYSIYLSDGKDGEIQWLWNDFQKYPTLLGANHQAIIEDKYIFSRNTEVYSIDLISGATFWRDYRNNGFPGLNKIGTTVFHTRIGHTYLKNQYAWLNMKPADGSSDWKEVLSLNKDSLDGYSPSIKGPSLWLSPSGDSIFLFQNRSWNFDISDGRIDLYAYNYSKKQLEFVLEDIEPTGNSNVLPPFVDGDRCYILGNRNLHCIDLVKQEIIWQKGFPGFGHHLMLSNLVVDGNTLIVKPDNDAIYGFNKHTGDLIWHTYEAGHSPSHMQFWNGMVFYTSDGDGKLFAVRTSDGEIIWAEDSPHDGDRKYPAASFNDTGVAINEELGLLYTCDAYYMMAFKLPGT